MLIQLLFRVIINHWAEFLTKVANVKCRHLILGVLDQ